jgi:spermidine synthase
VSRRRDRGVGRRSILSGAAAFSGLTVLGRASAASPERILETTRSPFNEIQITERAGVRTMYFIVDGARYIESRWDMNRPRVLDLDYSRTMMAGLLVQPAPTRLMMMGVGGGSISNYLFERFPNLEIDAVDIDPEVVHLARRWFGVPKDARYRTHVGDGRLFVESSTQRWDMLMLDAFRGVFVPYHLKTQEFYEACRSRLAPQGVVVANLHNKIAMYSSDRQTLSRVFAQQYGFISERGNQTTFVAGLAPRVGTFAMRANARALAPKFGFDLLGLAARHYLRTDWNSAAPVLRDDFKPEELERAAARHNETCLFDCAYPTR